MIAYFSGTGNTEWVANRLSTLLCDTNLVRIPAREPVAFDGVDTLAICFPVHSWGVPSVVRQFLDLLPKEYPIPYIYMVCTCGDDSGLTLDEFQQLVVKQNQRCKAFFSVQMPNTYVNLPGFDIDSEQVQQQKIRQAENTLQQIAETVQKKEECQRVVKGDLPWFKSKIIRPLFNRYLVSDSFFHVADSCRSCGACERICPVENIHLEKHPVWSHQGKCLTCMACYHVCPEHAISFGNYTSKKGQYLFKHTKN